MYAVGHLALGYLSGKAASKILNVNVNIPLLFLVSVLPDIDLLIPGLKHRGPLHSVVVFCLLFLPVIILLKKRAIPYFVALIQHILIGDLLTKGTQFLWPVTANWYGLEISSLTNIFLEWTLFLASIMVMIRTKDAALLLQQHTSNAILSVPVLTVLLPTFLGFPISVPRGLIIPHLIYIAFFTLSIFRDWKVIQTKT